MGEFASDLLSMADIARLAGQSRSTVGNWKARDADFPVEHSRGPRGPLYERGVVVTWLAEKGRLAEPASGEGEVLRLLELLRDRLPDHLAVGFMQQLVSLRSAADAEEWQRIVDAGPTERFALLEAVGADHGIEWDLYVIEEDLLDVRLFKRVVDGLVAVDEEGFMWGALEIGLRARAIKSGGDIDSGSALSLARFMSALTGSGASFYDPAMKDGFSLVMASVVSKVKDPDIAPYLYGQVADPRAVETAEAILSIFADHVSIESGDVFVQDRFPDLLVDRIVTQPPVGPMGLVKHLDPDDPRWVYGEPASREPGGAWVQHCLFHLAEGGRAVIALHPRILADQGRSGRIMQGVVKAGCLEAVITLPPRILPDSPVSPVVLILSTGRDRVDGKPPPALMVDLEEVHVGGGRRTRVLPAELTKRVAAMYETWTEGAIPDDADAAIATYDQIVENGFDLTPRHYFHRPSEDFDVTGLLREAADLRAQVEAAGERARLADDELHALLSGGGR